MYVCVCHAITERQVRIAVAQGIDSVEALSFELGVGTNCGNCRQTAAEVIQDCRGCLRDRATIEALAVT